MPRVTCLVTQLHDFVLAIACSKEFENRQINLSLVCASRPARLFGLGMTAAALTRHYRISGEDSLVLCKGFRTSRDCSARQFSRRVSLRSRAGET